MSNQLIYPCVVDERFSMTLGKNKKGEWEDIEQGASDYSDAIGQLIDKYEKEKRGLAIYGQQVPPSISFNC